ncbi:MAG: PP2C family serine/threonine-protein phosphatase [Planctomycetota bacterium]
MSESLPNWDAYINVASLSDVGMRRSNNQDNFIVSLASTFEQWQRKGHLFVVADGMGAHAAGELASKLAVDHIPHIYSRLNDVTPAEALQKAVVSANSEINRKGQMNEDFHNMGTTCSAMALLPQGAVVAHIGDSRVYRLRQGLIEQLTFDHSLVWEMRATGQLSAEDEASGKIPRNVITRSLGPYPECKVDVEGPFPLQVGDVFLMCSDGLSGMVSDAEMGAILSTLPPREAVRVLVDLANLRGGPDNSTVIVTQIIHQQLATKPGTVPVVAPQSSNSPVPTVAWVVFGALVVAAILIGVFVKNLFAGLIPGVMALGVLIWILIKLLANSGQGGQDGTQRHGRGPYTRSQAADGPEVTSNLASVIEQLQVGARDQGWKINWDRINEMVAEAVAAKEKNDWPASIRAYGRSITFLMDQLRNQGGDSTIEY